MANLSEYKRKRDFRRTPEPAGKTPRAHGHRFVVQKHAATRLHYDFRLELDGTLKSWAVPKGPSLDPAVKSLAVQVEDHPLEYASFEGVIPRGEYGGGTVMVWDQGTWEPEGSPGAAYRKGRLKFKLHGRKLKGEWALVRMAGRSGGAGKNWLLIKHADDAARPGDEHDFLNRRARSVVSDRNMEEIAADADRVWSSKKKSEPAQGTRVSSPKARVKATDRAPTNTTQSRHTVSRNGKPASGKRRITVKDVRSLSGARAARQPKTLKPHLAVLVWEAPDGEDWLHEMKYDGYRMLAFLEQGRARLVTRNGNDWTRRFPAIQSALEELPVKDAILDGEIVSLDQEGRTNFQQLQNLLKRGDDSEIVYYLFDMPHCLGRDLTKTPLCERKELLGRIVRSAFPNKDSRLRYSEHIAGEGPAVLEQARRLNMEGIVSKRSDSGYSQSRSPSWLKIKCSKRQEFVIGGYTKPTGSRKGLGALLLGYYQDGRLIYCGRVGTGFTDQTLRQLTAELRGRRIDAPPFENPPTGRERRGVTWVRPELVCEVEFTEWTEDGNLRHPSFQGLREDKRPGQVRRELPRTSPSAAVSRKTRQSPQVMKRESHRRAGEETISVAGVAITHPDRVLYAEAGVTKLDLAKYYESLVDWVLPGLVNRPLTLVRCPQGSKGKCFYQKHVTESLPDRIRGVAVQEKGKTSQYVVVDDLPGLISLVQLSVLEFHPWSATADDLDRPDQIVFDLDPGPGVAWSDVIAAAREVRDELAARQLQSFVRTSGGKGLHVVAPIRPRRPWDEVKEFTRDVAFTLASRDAKRYVATMSKSKRQGRVFIDYLRNARGATSVASYSSRARGGAPVAMPLRWEELGRTESAHQFTVANAPRRMSRMKTDPWEGFFQVRQELPI